MRPTPLLLLLSAGLLLPAPLRADAGKIIGELTSPTPPRYSSIELSRLYAEAVEELAKKLSSDKESERKEPAELLDKLATHTAAQGTADQRKALGEALSAHLSADSRKAAVGAARAALARALAAVAGPESLPLVRSLATGKDAEVAAATREGLLLNPSPQVVPVIAAALGATQDAKARADIARGLALRKDAAALALVEKALAAPDKGVVEAALAGLEESATLQGAAALVRALPSLKEEAQKKTFDSLLKIGRSLKEAGQSEEAGKIFQKAGELAQTPEQRTAALAARLDEGQLTPEMVKEGLLSSKAEIRDRSLQMALASPDEATVQALREALPKLPAAQRAEVITALAEKNAPQADEIALSQLDSSEAAVRDAAAAALQKLQPEKHLEELLKIYRSAKPEAREAAGKVLAGLESDAVRQKLMDLAASPGTPAGLGAVQLLAERKTPGLGDRLLEASNTTDRQQMTAALEGLAIAGSDEHVEPLVTALHRAIDSSRINALGSALSGIISRSEDPAKFVPQLGELVEIADAKRSDAVFGPLEATRSPEAVPHLVEGTKSREPAARQRAVQALGAIGVPEAAEPLLAILEDDPQLRAEAAKAAKTLAGKLKDATLAARLTSAAEQAR